MDVDVIGGDGPSAEQWARWTHTIGDEIVTSIPAHVRRVFVRP
jgi:alanine racemase